MHLAESLLTWFPIIDINTMILPLYDFFLGLMRTGCRLLLLIRLLIGRFFLLSLLSRVSLARFST